VTHQSEHLSDEILSALVDDRLTPDEKAQLQAHLASCSECQQRLEELRSVARLLRRLPDVEPSRDFSLGPRTVADPPNVVRLRRWYTATRIAAATLAAGWLFLAAGALYIDSRPTSVSVEVSTSQGNSAPAPAARDSAATPSTALKSAAPAAAPQPSPAAGAAAAARPAPANPQPDDQIAAATSVNPLPTPVPTPRPTPAPLPLRLPVTTSSVDPGAPLRVAAILVGLVALLTLLAALLVRHRLQRTASHL
jgi:anti-sigma factor RsiW